MHAKLVRVLTPEAALSFCRVDTSVFHALFTFAGSSLFPNLRKLVYPFLGIQSESFGYLANFISPSIEEFVLSEGRLQVSKAVMDSLRICHSLKRIELPPTSEEPGVTTSLRQILLQSPQLRHCTLRFPLEPVHFATLMRMENLEEISVVIPEHYALTNMEPSQPAFTHLHSLSISFHSCRQAADTLASSRFPKVTQLSLSLATGLWHPHEVKHLATTIANGFPRDTLSSIEISASLPHGTALNWNEELAIQPSTLRPFLLFSKISRFTIEDTNCSFDLDDAFLDEMANAWPCLIELVIAPSGMWPPTSRTTLASLVSFAKHCKGIHTIMYNMEGSVPNNNLDDEYIDEYDDSDDEDEEESQEVASADCLQLLNVGCGRVVSIRRAAVFVSKVCPSLRDIGVGYIVNGGLGSDTYKEWNLVAKWARTLAAARRGVRRRAHEEPIES